MSFDVKNIENENIDFKKMGGIFLFLTLCIIGSAIFVYFWFTLEKRAVQQEQYFGPKSELYQKHQSSQHKFIEEEYNISIDKAKDIFIKERSSWERKNK
tara:strand:+ start:1253 stop:1549 length:297 start_codon:yes stop_codon:yes gene_type:complete